ncbi:MAG TPA: hypothetical protein VF865_01270 [Acidobacteriaceae bacterium]
MPKSDKGPPLYANWQAALHGKKVIVEYEVPLFSDADIMGAVEGAWGPYDVLNPSSTRRPAQRLAPVLILRFADHIADSMEDYVPMDRTDDTLYHGGTLLDEMTALLSLCLGVRFKPGGVTRVFRPEWRDPKGHPAGWETYEDPILPPLVTRPVIPRALGRRSIGRDLPVASLPLLSADGATALLRSARAYQDGLWLAESHPEMSWILFVAAIESAAGYWRSEVEAPVDRLRTSRPDVAAILIDAGGEKLEGDVAELMAVYMGATRKFIDFLQEFLPPPPAVRPPLTSQIPWGGKELEDIFKMVYQYRSRALHGGRPFPAPMCHPPEVVAESEACAERPTGLAIGALGGTWMTKDLPLFLSTFEYMVRGTLLRWWRSMADALPTDLRS